MFLKKGSSDSLWLSLFGVSLTKTAVCIPDTISIPDWETREIRCIMCTKITLFVLDAVKTSLLKVTLCIFSAEIWQEGKSNIQVRKTLRFITVAN